jgi:hypothetical protein
LYEVKTLVTQAEDGLELQFLAGIQQLATDEKGKHTATFYIMNTSRNRVGWGVTEKALSEALPTLKKAKLGIGPDYKIDKHYPDSQAVTVGAFHSYEQPKPNYATANAQITDETVWGKMAKGEVGPVSVVIHAYDVSCSKCGVVLRADKSAGEHVCIKNGDGYENVGSFIFHRVDFVDVPAYPQAGLLDMAAQTEQKTIPLTLLASFYESQARSEEKTEGNNEESTLSEKELEKKVAGLEQANQKLTSDLEAAVSKATEGENTVKTLKGQLDGILKAQHEELVAATLGVRVKAKVAGKPEDEKTMLAALPNETLIILKADAEKVAGLPVSATAAGPITKYAKQADSDLETAMKEKAAALGFPDRSKEGA